MAETKKLSHDDVVELTDRIAGLASAELPLVHGLIALGAEVPAGPLRESMFDLARSLESGVPLEEALQHQEGRIPPQFLGLMRAGLRTGRLGDLLGRFSIYSTVGTELRRRLRLSLAYPIISVVVAFAIFAFVCTCLVPQFEAIFRDFGLPVPNITQFLFRVSDFFQWAWPAIVTMAIVGVAALGVGIFLDLPTRRGFAGRLPILGTIWRSASLAEFFHLLALLLEGEVPLPEAVRLAGDGVQDADLKRASGLVAQEVDSGRGLAEALASVHPFPPGFSHLLKWAERPGSLPEVLHMIGEMFEARARSRLVYAASLVSVLSIVCIIWGVFVVVLGLMLPMVMLISRLSG